MAVKSRKVKIGNRCFYITVNKKDYLLKVGGSKEGLEGYTDELGDYVIIEGEKYYIYLGDKPLKENDKGKKIVLLFDGEKFKKKQTDGSLQDLRELLECEYIESPFLGTNIDKAGIYWTIDEEGTYTSPITLLMTDFKGEVLGAINGKILFSRTDEKGDLKGLSDKDIEFIKKEIMITLQRETPVGYLLHRVVTGIR